MKILDNSNNLSKISNIKYFSNITKGIKPFFINEFNYIFNNKKILVILNDNTEINEYYNLFTDYFNNKNILKFPSWDNTPYEEVSPSQKILSERFNSFNFKQNTAISNNNFIILTNLDAFLQLVPKEKYLKHNSNEIRLNDKISLTDLNSKLQDLGYEKVSIVLEPYEYAVRGGILDLWPIGSDSPLRIDFLGNNIDSIKKFNPISQMTLKNINMSIISGSLESPRGSANKKKFIQNYRNLFGPVTNDQLFVVKLKNNMKAEGIENWLPLFYPSDMCSLLDYFNVDIVLSDNYFREKSKEKLKEIYNLYEEKKNMLKNDKDIINAPLSPSKFYLSSENIKKIIYNENFIELNFLSPGKLSSNYEIKCNENIEFHNMNITNEDIIKRLKNIISNCKDKKKVIIAYFTKDEKNKAQNLIKNIEIKKVRENKKYIHESLDDLDLIDLVSIPIVEGFETPLIKVITINEIFKTKKAYISQNKTRNNLIDIAQLHLNDLVVHVQHGIGKYLGLKTISINNSPHDCLIIEYQEKSKLYVPVEDIRLISKFGEARASISLDKLGASSWEKRKFSVTKKIKELANSLITLAAKRSTLKGKKYEISYSKLDDFSKGFNFAETDDQLASLNEVYKDLSSGKLMDRLVCGDVGFGKTEIALRAACIVANNNSNVLVIAPTTLLARQHYNTFKKRFHNYHVVELLDRNTRISRKKNIIANYLNKEIKIIVATHAIFSVNLNEADIGLVIVDEEQRFGVAHKEKIKKIKTDVHLLTLTATPIPRTLHMSLLGIKDLSLIKTPPVDRKSVETKVIKFDRAIIKHALLKEKNRAGQIYMIVPKIKDIPIILKKITSIYPNLKIGIAHGKLSSAELESVMESFYNYKTDLLISTTIVEAGLDIPRANTLIVYKSDYFGLAQLHQLRGRIGRSDKKAYALFTLENNIISRNAVRRLKALQTMDELGAGMQLANYDLDIRGAGNLLGEEQSGQITQVGIEMYQRLLTECINDLKGKHSFNNAKEIEVSIKLPILIPDKYIPDLSLRLSLYRRVGEIQSLKEMQLFKEEMINRFGLIPDEFSNYLNVMVLKLLARQCSISKIHVLSQFFSLTFNKNRKNYSENFIKWITNNKNKIILSSSHVIKIKHQTEGGEKQLIEIIDLTKTMIELLKK